MFDIGWTELLLIGIVALIVVGPKDLPGMFRTLGRFTGKARAMARDFQRAMNDAADEAGVKDLNAMAGDLRKAASPTSMGLDRLNEAADKFEKWEPGKGKKKPEDGDAPARGPETEKLGEERAEAARKIRERAAETAKKRIAAETAAASETASGAAPAAAKPAKPARAARPAATLKPKKPAGAAKPAKPARAARPAATAKPAGTTKPAAAAKTAKPARTAKPAGDSAE